MSYKILELDPRQRKKKPELVTPKSGGVGWQLLHLLTWQLSTSAAAASARRPSCSAHFPNSENKIKVLYQAFFFADAGLTQGFCNSRFGPNSRIFALTQEKFALNPLKMVKDVYFLPKIQYFLVKIAKIW